MRRVSRTLWSVTTTPIPRDFSWSIIFCTSATEIGSMAANGSSISRNFGRETSAFAARERECFLFRQVPEVQFLQVTFDASGAFSARHAYRFDDRQDVLL